MSGAGELLSGRQTRGSGADHGNRLAGLNRRSLGYHPALLEGVVDDGDLDLLDGDGVLVDTQDTCAFARRRAKATGELGEVVGGVKAIDGCPPLVAVDQVVPVGNQVAQRAAVVAEGDATVHTTTGLNLQIIVGKGFVDLFPVVKPHRHRPPLGQLASVLEKTSYVAHCQPLAAAMTASSMSLPCSSAAAIASSTRL